MAETARSHLARYRVRLEQKSASIPRVLTRNMSAFATAWAGIFLLASLMRILSSPTPAHGVLDWVEIVAPYLLIALAPAAGYLLAARSFPAGTMTAQPDIRLAIYGRWRRLNLLDVRANPAFGAAGFMASLLVGLLLNVVMRSFEFLLAVPALTGHAPLWGRALFQLMAADVVVMSFFYMVCFVMALRNIPYFPRMLLFAWALDIAIQMIIAQRIGATAGLPVSVAGSLRNLLGGNIEKVLISAFVWLPYLILSERVNVTYRHRVRGRRET